MLSARPALSRADRLYRGNRAGILTAVSGHEPALKFGVPPRPKGVAGQTHGSDSIWPGPKETTSFPRHGRCPLEKPRFACVRLENPEPRRVRWLCFGSRRIARLDHRRRASMHDPPESAPP